MSRFMFFSDNTAAPRSGWEECDAPDSCSSRITQPLLVAHLLLSLRPSYSLSLANIQPTLCYPLSDPFIRYLLGHPDPESSADPPPFLLPRPASGHDPLPRTTARIDPTSSLSPSTDSDSDNDPRSHSFPDLEDAVNLSIAALCGIVLPKLNWNSPKDAA
ncbi:hypothetical protein J5N97_029062 [Dioscorea zingiberensis]|uniref:Uncharacterized protein n=1 Tax=Dioscorea zingiberensis TaxID=325984 RepID=A0A9D5C070_9LILI|nr:hypothetical protein J5N97_029062 [Dioscorea zingiberensis]